MINCSAACARQAGGNWGHVLMRLTAVSELSSARLPDLPRPNTRSCMHSCAHLQAPLISNLSGSSTHLQQACQTVHWRPSVDYRAPS